jgi:ribosomal protein S21
MASWKENNWNNNRNNDERVFKGTTIFVKNNDITRALRKLKKRLQDEGWFNDIRKHEHYVAKGEKRRRKMAVAQVREKKRQKDFSSAS